ncbi:MAG TPA: translation elongation factor G [Clostridiales bacterium UBA8960]|nr:translation elongation factor G [Clostridiales bacterium UBA8960]
MKKMTVGILAHVDAGKTTLSESMLYLSGKIKKMGRVDNRDAYLDTYALEKTRGITIFSKQAIFEFRDYMITLLDTPGHVDFSAEMERTLRVLDYAILVVSGADGVQGHTRTLWRLLEIYDIPVFIFVNKMDQPGTEQSVVMHRLKSELAQECVDFGTPELDVFYDALAMCDEKMMVSYIETHTIGSSLIEDSIKRRKVFPCYFGSALKVDGVEAFMNGLAEFLVPPTYPDSFGARVFKIARDESGTRLTHMKITGGTLKVKDVLKGRSWEEKVNQIRVYSGTKYEAVNEVSAGAVCAVTGLSRSMPWEGLGFEEGPSEPILEPVLSFLVILPKGQDARLMMPKLSQLEEEEPEFKFKWDERFQEIHVQIMGEVQLEILASLLAERFGVDVTFGEGSIVYKETISDKAYGVGHFEPLRHYAEVHLLLEPGEPGSGLQFATECREEILGKNWQNLVLTHLREKDHVGVLTGAVLTDMRITLVAGKGHNKHTVGGDFREATFRAVRQGLMEATSVLLEPYYAFQLELPTILVGRAMTDVEKMHGVCEILESRDDFTTLKGNCPVATMRNYQLDVVAFTKGQGRLYTSLNGYGLCHNACEVVEKSGYHPDRDVDNPSDSIFCTQGSGYVVPWYEVKSQMHVEQHLKEAPQSNEEGEMPYEPMAGDKWLSLEEIDQIVNSTYNANQGKKTVWTKHKSARESYYESSRYVAKPKATQKAYLLVDGYNIIFAWPELKALAEDNMDGAKAKLLDILSNYQGIKRCEVVVVFDAYKVEGRREEVVKYHNIYLVYTSEAQTADHYIEKFAHMNRDIYEVTVATSDGLQQMIIRGAGASLLSARELKEVVEKANNLMREDLAREGQQRVSKLEDVLPSEVIKKLK